MEKCKYCGKEINLRVDEYVEIDEIFPQGSKFKLHKACYEVIGSKK